jgi:hypothetical protein
MTGLDWTALGLGLGIGMVFSAIFLAGLAYGIRLALRQNRPGRILLASGALRVALLLAAGWAIATHLGPAGALGYAAAFLVLRTLVVGRIRAGLGAGVSEWS